MSIEVGAKVTGKVSGITNFGAFVDLGDRKNGLVHISEVSDGYVKDIHDVLSVGDEVTVKVLSIAEDGKISLSIRKAAAPSREKTQVSRTNRTEHGNNYHSSGTDVKTHNSSGHRQSYKKTEYKKSNEAKKTDFDSLLSGFLKDSEVRLTSLKRNTEGKRGGRGGRRS